MPLFPTRHLPALCTVLSLTVFGCSPSQDTIVERPDMVIDVMSFNIRYDNPADGQDAWPLRTDWVAHLIDSSGADVVGLQEALYHQLLDIVMVASRFEWVGVGRDDGGMSGEFSPVLYDRERFELLDVDTRWLSETPDSVGSVGWDAALPRIATIVTLRQRSDGRTLRVLNTHFDHSGELARANSATLVKQWMSDSDIAMGDFNFQPDEAPWDSVTAGGLVDVALMMEKGEEGTFRSFDPEAGISNRIDYVFLNPAHQAQKVDILATIRNGRFPSDHLPVLASIRLKSDTK